MDKIRIRELKLTSYACPTQYEGYTIDNIPVYIRYRYGYLSIRLGDKDSDIFNAVIHGREVFGHQVGDDLDGYIDIEEIKEYTKEIIEWNKLNIKE